MTNRWMRRCGAVLALLVAPAAAVAQEAWQPEDTHGLAAATDAVTAREHMIAAANPVAAQTGLDVLHRGGNAIDAMVAVQIMLNLVEPQSSGIGGGAFMLYWNAEQARLTTFDGRETAPMAAGPDYFLQEDGTPKSWWDAMLGGRSVGVPGTLKLLEVTHKLHGNLPWADLLQPTIDLAEKGFDISPRLAASIAGFNDDKRQLGRFAATRAYFFNPDGSPKTAGTVLKNPEFAETLRVIAAQGADAFYRGAIAADIVQTVRHPPENPGVMTTADLASYRVKERPPVCPAYRGYEVCGMGPPTSGGLTVGQILGLLEHFDLPNMNGTDAAHLFAEASKLAYADRGMYMADADFVSMPVDGLLDPVYLTARAQLISPDRAMPPASAGNPPWRTARMRAPHVGPERPGTSHFVIRDPYGNAVSMTTTIESGFGSKMMVRGFLLNNELTDFSRAPEKNGRPIANRVEPGKRPRSSMAPTIVMKDGLPYLLVGSPGGSRIIEYVAKTVVAVLDWGMDPQQAIDLGHVVNRNGETTEIETGLETTLDTALLEARGHQIKVRDLNSGLHAILIEPDGTLIGGADRRREGIAAGN